MAGHCNQDRQERRNAQGQHMIPRTGHPDRINRTMRTEPLGQYVQLKQSMTKVIISLQNSKIKTSTIILNCVFG